MCTATWACRGTIAPSQCSKTSSPTRPGRGFDFEGTTATDARREISPQTVGAFNALRAARLRFRRAAFPPTRTITAGSDVGIPLSPEVVIEIGTSRGNARRTVTRSQTAPEGTGEV